MGRMVLAGAQRLAAASLVLALVGCPPTPPTPPEPPQPVQGATCGDACEHWRALGCEQGRDTPAGATCEEVCANIQDSGIVDLDLECGAGVTACEQIDACERDR